MFNELLQEEPRSIYFLAPGSMTALGVLHSPTENVAEVAVWCLILGLIYAAGFRIREHIKKEQEEIQNEFEEYEKEVKQAHCDLLDLQERGLIKESDHYEELWNRCGYQKDNCFALDRTGLSYPEGHWPSTFFIRVDGKNIMMKTYNTKFNGMDYVWIDYSTGLDSEMKLIIRVIDYTKKYYPPLRLVS